MSSPATPDLDRYVAIDYEMVRGFSGRLVCKVAIVDHAGQVLLESFVHVPPEEVREYLTEASGIEASHLEGAPAFDEISPQINDILKDKIVVGHALWNDFALTTTAFRAIRYPISPLRTRDTALFHPLREMMGITKDSFQPSLSKMAMCVLGLEMRKGEGEAHDPVEDARAAMDISLTVRQEYEAAIAQGAAMASVPKAYRKWYLAESEPV
ncbi:hypothetical protein IAT38_002241 [Cryptococcus sp. DSM 104549]